MIDNWPDKALRNCVVALYRKNINRVDRLGRCNITYEKIELKQVLLDFAKTI